MLYDNTKQASQYEREIKLHISLANNRIKIVSLIQNKINLIHQIQTLQDRIHLNGHKHETNNDLSQTVTQILNLGHCQQSFQQGGPMYLIGFTMDLSKHITCVI